MTTSYKIKKVITNNILRAVDFNDQEVILIGKGIGYQRKAADIISSNSVENIFVLKDKQEKELYNQLLQTTSPKLINIANMIVDYIQNHVDKPLNEHIHIALTDHIAFLVRRCKMGIPVENPFIYETECLYPKEMEIAQHVIKMLSEQLNVEIPNGEVGFITLHIVSSMTNETITNMQKVTLLINKLTDIIEQHLPYTIDRKSLNYTRLVTHLRFAVERILRGEVMKTPDEFDEILKNKYPQCYALAWKLVKIMQNELKKEVNGSEAIYLSLHLYRFDTEY